MGFVKTIKALFDDYKECRGRTREAFAKSESRRRSARYALALETCQVRSDVVLYESNWGRGVVDNPYAIFKHLLAEPRYAHLKHIWAVENPDALSYDIMRFADYDNVSFVRLHSDEYLEALATAGFLINNSAFHSYFVKRPGQVYVNTWHGTPLKNMGYEMPDGNTGSAHTMRNFLSADYLLSANSVMTNMYFKSYKLDGVLPGAVLEAGYPRNDLLFSSIREEVCARLAGYGIETDPLKKTILYAPTWRKGKTGGVSDDVKELLMVKTAIEGAVDLSEWQVLIKPHQFAYSLLKDDPDIGGMLVPSYVDANELLSMVDVLVSDFSSIFYDFLATGRPIIFYIPDVEDYTESRGLQRSLDNLPGPLVDNPTAIAPLIADIDAVDVEYASARERLANSICGYDDGNVTERVVRAVFDGDESCVLAIRDRHVKKRLLINGGLFLENGITRSFSSLLNSIDYSEWDVTAYVIAQQGRSDMAKRINEDINPNARVLVRVGDAIATEAEEVRREFATQHGLYREFWKGYYPHHIMEREFRRCFGQAEFDYVVEFNGHNRLEAPMFLHAGSSRKSIWLHSDIQSDMNRSVNGKKPLYTGLNFVVSLYPRYDNLVSCGRTVMQINRDKLATSETEEKFHYACNTVDVKRYENSLEEREIMRIGERDYYVTFSHEADNGCVAAEAFELPDGVSTSFVTMGRLSTEKNHAALIEAFARYREGDRASKLYIIGEGPLRKQTEDLVTSLELTDSVVLTGNLSNPYALMRRCSCFVLPSIYEGQPLVLLEARMCGLPIVVSDFSSVTDSLIPDGQLVVGTTVESILGGLESYARGEVPITEFDAEAYNAKAYREFVEAIK